MSALASRLALLRREAGQQTGGRSAPALPAARVDDAGTVAPAAISIETLRRLLGVRTRNAPVVAFVDGALPGIEIAPGLRLVEHVLPWLEAPVSIAARFAAIDEVTRDRLLHFDTETTGLAGGTGTRAFMIGVAEWIPEGLRIRQLLLTTMGGETAMLATLAQWIRDDHVLVSYNGRCYDAPLLATRYRLARLPNPLAGLTHLDLLYPVRRRYRGVYENCRLATIERELLGVVREDDLPGAQAPAAWREYLRRGDAVDLRRVLDHNQQDLVSLARLLLRIGE